MDDVAIGGYIVVVDGVEIIMMNGDIIIVVIGNLQFIGFYFIEVWVIDLVGNVLVKLGISVIIFDGGLFIWVDVVLKVILGESYVKLSWIEVIDDVGVMVYCVFQGGE